MENLIFGLQALVNLIQVEAGVMLASPVMKGFIAGFIVAALLHGFLKAGEYRRRCRIETRPIRK